MTNVEFYELHDKIELVQGDLLAALPNEDSEESDPESDSGEEKVPKFDVRLIDFFDTIVMNPPFGTNNAGVDMKLLLVAARALKPGGQLFSLHKLKLNKPEMTKNFITKFV